MGKASNYNIFKAIDVDGDGFISYKDFETHLKRQKIIATQEEITTLMKHVLDPNNNGFIDFKEFTKKFGPNMSRKIEVEENELNLPNLVPSKDKL